MKITNRLLIPALIIFLASTFSSCVKKEYDEIVTANVDPNLTPTHTIHQLQQYATGPVGVQITEDIIIAGIAIADDSSGNIYKKLILQQDQSGIAIAIDISDYYVDYKVGRKIFVKCKGLFIANKEGNIELGISGMDPVGRIPSALVSQFVVPGKWGQYLAPTVYQLSDPNIPTNTLVKFENVEFQSGDNGIAWAATSPANLTIEDCAATPNTLIVYSSTFATFAFKKTPIGKGSIVGVYTIYSGDGELQIRDLNDVNMNDVRCDGSTGNPVLMQMDSIRMLDPGPGNIIYLPGDKKIEVTVTSNYATGMIGGAGRNAYVQDNTGGIQVRFSDAHMFALGTKLEINVSGRELSTFNGVLQINNIPLGNAIPIGTGTVTPIVATIADIVTNYNSWESRVVQINAVTVGGGGTYEGSKPLTDASGGGPLELFTISAASFSVDTVPTVPVSITGILTEYNGTKEILIRSLNDVQY